ncbi:hypothetical protein A464_plas0107 (plasmid) [Salmonella bongori N268-08]|uniref:Mobile element protein n=1 Tax=Salmonella bongori N268-08 TaxID=1197719 RepID=S5MZ07_SALBN|nr:hypothetical protein A464_plas0107 [Salmonella bongori N268-08]
MVKPQQLQRFDDGKNRPEKPDGRRAALRSQVLELHGISRGSAGARSIATMATQKGYQMGRWLAGRLIRAGAGELPAAHSPV